MPSKINLKVLLFDSDFFAAQAINGYFAWDRRTRVVATVYEVAEVFRYIQRISRAELPDVIVMEAEALPDASALKATIARLRQTIPSVMIVCLAHHPNPQHATAAAESGARAYLLRNELKSQLVGAIVYALDHKFVVTPGVQNMLTAQSLPLTGDVLPPHREYPEMTERIRQALWLCVVEGMPAHLAADEMGISPHTIRSYIKEGYRILEAHDDTAYPEEMGPLERAFMRFTALDDENDEDTPPPTPPTKESDQP